MGCYAVKPSMTLAKSTEIASHGLVHSRLRLLRVAAHPFNTVSRLRSQLRATNPGSAPQRRRVREALI
jgi:hypothetical protein